MPMENVPNLPSPERPPLAPYDPPDPAPQAVPWGSGAQESRLRADGSPLRFREFRGVQNHMNMSAAGRKQEIAIGIALQTHLVTICPIHKQLYCGYDEYPDDDDRLARAFGLAIELVREHRPFSEEFHHNVHELTDLLSDTISAAPLCCPDCPPPLSERYGDDAASSGYAPDGQLSGAIAT